MLGLKRTKHIFKRIIKELNQFFVTIVTETIFFPSCSVQFTVLLPQAAVKVPSFLFSYTLDQQHQVIAVIVFC